MADSAGLPSSSDDGSSSSSSDNNSNNNDGDRKPAAVSTGASSSSSPPSLPAQPADSEALPATTATVASPKRKRTLQTNNNSNASSSGASPLLQHQQPSAAAAAAALAGVQQKNTHENRWEEMYQRLVDFHRTHGHSNVPNRYESDPQLGSWGTSIVYTVLVFLSPWSCIIIIVYCLHFLPYRAAVMLCELVKEASSICVFFFRCC